MANVLLFQMIFTFKWWIKAEAFFRCWRALFETADMLKEMFDHIPQFSLGKEKNVLDQNLS